MVDSVPFYEREVSLETGLEAHSLNYACFFPETSNPEVARFLIETYSSIGSVVLDPFCGSGTILLESAMKGRVAFGSDINPLASFITSAKLSPADIAEVTLWLQMLNLKRPVDLEEYNSYFRPFYDVNTYRELVNLKGYLNLKEDRISNFIKLLAVSLLHGNSNSYFSVGTAVNTCLSPNEQMDFNAKKSQSPDYRAVVPRLIKRCAQVMLDGLPSSLSKTSRRKVAVADSRNLDYVPSNSVDLVVTNPPMFKNSNSQWIEDWFLGKRFRSAAEEWEEFMNSSLLEMARVLFPGGRVTLICDFDSYKKLYDLVNEHLSRYFDCESVIVNQVKKNVIKGTSAGKNYFLVLRRK